MLAEETESGGENGSRVLRVTGELLLISALHDISLNSQRESNEGRKCQYSEAFSPPWHIFSYSRFSFRIAISGEFPIFV